MKIVWRITMPSLKVKLRGPKCIWELWFWLPEFHVIQSWKYKSICIRNTYFMDYCDLSIYMLVYAPVLSMSCRTISMWFWMCGYMCGHCMLAFICMWVLSFTSSFVDVPYTCHTICIQQICYVYIVYVSLKYISFNGKALNSKTHLLDQYGWKVWSQIHTSDVFCVLKNCIINFI